MPIIFFILGLLLRLFRLGMRPFDGDEGVILLQATPKSFHEMIARTATDAHPPLATTISWVVNKLVPQGEFYYRLIPAITGTLALIAIYYLSKEIFGKNKLRSYLVLFLATVSPYLIFYSQEIRMYNFLVLFSTLSTLFAIKLTKKYSITNIVYYIIYAALMVYTVHIGWIIIFCQFLFMYREKIKLKTLSLIFATLLLIYLPIIRISLNQVINRLSEGTSGHALDIVNNIKGISGAFFRFGSGRLILDLNPGSIKNMLVHEPLTFILFLLILVVPFWLFVSGYLEIKDKKFKLFVNIVFITSIVIGLIYSEMGGRAVRYFIYLFPLYLIVIANIKPTLINKILLAIFILINLFSLYHRYFIEFKSKNIKDIVTVLDQKYQNGDIVFYKGTVSSGEKYVFNYYSKGKFDSYDFWDGYKVGNMKELGQRKESDIIKNLLTAHPKVWFYPVGYVWNEANQFSSIKEYNLGKDFEGINKTLYEISK